MSAEDVLALIAVAAQPGAPARVWRPAEKEMVAGVRLLVRAARLRPVLVSPSYGLQRATQRIESRSRWQPGTWTGD